MMKLYVLNYNSAYQNIVTWYTVLQDGTISAYQAGTVQIGPTRIYYEVPAIFPEVQGDTN